MSDNNFKRPERIKNALDNRKLNLSAPTPGHQGKTASLIWGLYGGANPRLTVYTNDPNDQDAKTGYGKISANLDAPTFFAFLNYLDQACKLETPNDWKIKLENKNFTFFNGKRSDAPSLVSELIVGKDKDGVIWIAVFDKNKDRPKIKFQFGYNDFHRFVYPDGNPVPANEVSVAYAQGYITLLRGVVPNLLVDLYQEPEPKPNQGGNRGGQGGGYNRGGQGGGGYNRSNAPATEDVGEDIPF